MGNQLARGMRVCVRECIEELNALGRNFDGEQTGNGY